MNREDTIKEVFTSIIKDLERLVTRMEILAALIESRELEEKEVNDCNS